MRSLLFLALASTVTACSPYDPDLGDSPFICGPADQNPRCPDGYACQMDSNGVEYCLAPAAMVPVDASNLNCADDSMLEPNDMIGQAWQAPNPFPPTPFKLSGLTICPPGDKDNYSLTVTQGQNLEMLFEYSASGADLQGAILNSTGTPIIMASAMSGTTGTKRAYVANLPAGVYYASVYGPVMGSTTTNNYRLTLTVTGP